MRVRSISMKRGSSTVMPVLFLLLCHRPVLGNDESITGVFENDSGHFVVTTGSTPFEQEADMLLSKSVQNVYYGHPGSNLLYPLILSSSRLGMGPGDRNNRSKMLMGFYVPSRNSKDEYARLSFGWTEKKKEPSITVQCSGKRGCFRFNQSVTEEIIERIKSGEIEFAAPHTVRVITRAYRLKGKFRGNYLLVETEAHDQEKKALVHFGRKRDFTTIDSSFFWDPKPEEPRGSHRDGAWAEVSIHIDGGKILIRYPDHDPDKPVLQSSTVGIIPLEEFKPDMAFLKSFGLPVSEFFPLVYPTPCNALLPRLER